MVLTNTGKNCDLWVKMKCANLSWCIVDNYHTHHTVNKLLYKKVLMNVCI